MPAHKHAAIIMQYAEKAQVSERPWEFFEVKVEETEWSELGHPPAFDRTYEYRLKPTTIRIGEYDVPDPLRVMPMTGELVFLADISNPLYHTITYFDKAILVHVERWRMGLLHETKEAAILHSKALVSLTARGDV